MSKAPIYLPISLLDVFEMIEDGKLEQIFVEYQKSLSPAKNFNFTLSELDRKNFYIKQEYIPKDEQESKHVQVVVPPGYVTKNGIGSDS
ncbi:hypothetical protein JZO73_10255 [Enterococcus plantarum]|uniref:hypothetical protein n=1 Tax=Enterococcus plantarum TaxID=1077675 RepID=UPI001A8D6E91|nr:hypothetical protein [Enterococcus plantarum]MBO0467912.1 hypothetical protein [Enterococcus plantarum]